MKRLFGLILIAVFSVNTFAQELYIPRNIKNAIAKETRTLDGKPGKNYWQNTGNYKIDFSVNAEAKTISGKEKIEYFNNSPDSLKTFVLRLVNNVHKPISPRAGKASTDFLTSGIEIKKLIINGEIYAVKSENIETFYELKLNKALLPKSKNSVEIEWEYPLSKQSAREGQIDENTFFCAYAYPRISVYDDYNGWDKLPHNGRNEFYNDFNNYEVSIAAPKNFIVYATGVLKNAEEVLQPEILNKFKKSLTSDEIIHVATKEEIAGHKVTKQNALNTWKFSAQNITDFTFGASSSYIWDASSVQLKSKKVSVQATYNAGTADFEKYLEWQKYCIKWFSENWPGIEYPFPTMTAFQGFADMEFPMMVNDTAIPDNLPDSSQTVDHEIAHTYFPFFMGINETRYAFMDEGWATAFEYLIGEAENGKDFNDNAFKNFRVKRYINDPSTEEYQPVISLSTQVTGIGYGNNSYVKPAFSYLALKDLLGDDLFKKSLHHYMNTWSGKHPIPWDFFGSMNAGSGQNLNWFWNNWFFSNNYIDLKLNSTKMEGKNLTLSIENQGGFAIPFDAEITFLDGTISTKHFTPEVWKMTKTFNTKIPAEKKVKSVKIDGGIFMDYTPKDNLKTF